MACSFPSEFSTAVSTSLGEHDTRRDTRRDFLRLHTKKEKRKGGHRRFIVLTSLERSSKRSLAGCYLLFSPLFVSFGPRCLFPARFAIQQTLCHVDSWHRWWYSGWLVWYWWLRLGVRFRWQWMSLEPARSYKPTEGRSRRPARAATNYDRAF